VAEAIGGAFLGAMGLLEYVRRRDKSISDEDRARFDRDAASEKQRAQLSIESEKHENDELLADMRQAKADCLRAMNLSDPAQRELRDALQSAILRLR
jgi:hypothetical protein